MSKSWSCDVVEMSFTFDKDFIFDLRYFAGSDSEEVDSLEHKPFRPRSSQVGKSVQELKEDLHALEQFPMTLAEGLTVIYVPPIRGSEMRVWNAEIPTNCTVEVKEEKTVKPIK